LPKEQPSTFTFILTSGGGFYLTWHIYIVWPRVCTMFEWNEENVVSMRLR